MKKFFFVGLVLLSASPLDDFSTASYFVVWNVGQGQWTTAVSPTACLHFDFGGEFFPLKKMRPLCRGKEQKLFLSHWDWDHIGGLARTRENFCLAGRPLGKSSAKKTRLIESLRTCLPPADIQVWQPQLTKNTNTNSQIFVSQGVLIPGDSPVQQEVLWAPRLSLGSVRLLVLGHHGSKTSTSEALLLHLPRLRQAVASARWRRYRHPHPAVEARVHAKRIALLKTEDWGNIWFER